MPLNTFLEKSGSRSGRIEGCQNLNIGVVDRFCCLSKHFVYFSLLLHIYLQIVWPINMKK